MRSFGLRAGRSVTADGLRCSFTSFLCWPSGPLRRDYDSIPRRTTLSLIKQVRGMPALTVILCESTSREPRVTVSLTIQLTARAPDTLGTLSRV